MEPLMSRYTTRLLTLALVLCITSSSFAGPLATDPNAYNDGLIFWHGSTNYQGLDTFNQPTGLSGHVDWAVYPAGVVPAGLTGIGGYTPTPGEFLYTYQAYETGPADL